MRKLMAGIVVLLMSATSHAALLDNVGAGFSVSGHWPSSSFITGYYGANYQYTAPGQGGKTAAWRFEVGAGRYAVSAQWTAYPNRASDAAYTLVNNGVALGTLYADQRQDGGRLNLLGTVDVAAGSLEVVLSDLADGYVVADAVEVSPLSAPDNLPPDGVIDQPAHDLTIVAGESVSFLGRGSDPDGNTPLVYRWVFGAGSGVPTSTEADPGWVSFRTPGTFAVRLTVTDAAGLADPTPAVVTVTVVAGSDAAVIDNGDPGFDTVGYWARSTTIAGFYGGNYQYRAPGDGSHAALWRFDVGAGRHAVSAQWTAYPNRASDAAYTLVNNGVELGTLYADQRQDGGRLNLLGTVDVAAGSLEVVLSDLADGYVVADAVEVSPLSAPDNLPPDGVIDQPAHDLTIVAGESVSFLGSGSDPDDDTPLEHLWHFGDGSGVPACALEDPGRVRFNSVGDFVVTYTVVDADGLSDPEPATLRIRVLAADTEIADVCVYGGTAGGVMAAYAAAQMGASVALVEPGYHLGGMTSGGLGATDNVNSASITGLARAFYDRLGDHYGMPIALTHEPHMAEALLNDMVAEYPISVYFGRRLQSVDTSPNQYISWADFEDVSDTGVASIRIAAEVYIDASYEGDLMAQAGVSYIVGREPNSEYGETLNGIRPVATMPYGIDPYRLPGEPTSGLLPFSGISGTPLGITGSGDGLSQSYCYRLCMTQLESNRLEVLPPEGYDPADFELFMRCLLRRNPASLSEVFLIRPLPNGKWDWNSNENFGVSLDLVGENQLYPEADAETRAQIRQRHRYYSAGLLYLLSHDGRVPPHIRSEMQTWGLCRDEFQDTEGWPHQLYVREGRRMLGRYVLTEANCALTATVADGIAQGSYAVDSHVVQRYIDANGWVRNEGGFFRYPTGQIAAYDIPYRAITPRADECRNLIVPGCISASHVAYASARMEPVFMMMGEAAGRAAAMAAEAAVAVQEVDVAGLQVYLRDGYPPPH